MFLLEDRGRAQVWSERAIPSKSKPCPLLGDFFFLENHKKGSDMAGSTSVKASVSHKLDILKNVRSSFWYALLDP